MADTTPLHPRAFAGADLNEAVGALTALIDEHRPHVVVTYDPFGGYGHPDHIQAHTVTTAAVEKASWQVAKLYWTVIATSALETGLASITQLPPGCQPAPLDLIPTFADEKISAAIDVSGHREAKVAALRAHATQLTVSDDGSSMALSNLIALPIADIEHFVLVRGEPGVDTGWESDLFAGVEL